MRKLWLNKYMGKSGNWGDIWAEETVEDASSKVAGSGRSWLFLNEIEENLGKQVAAMMCNELDEKQKLLPEGDITHTRQHPDMTQSGRHGKQWNILAKKEEDEKKSEMRSVKVTTTVDLKKGLPEQLSMKDLPSTSSSASSTPVAPKSRKNTVSSKPGKDVTTSKFHQARMWLTKVKVDEIKTIMIEIESDAVKRHVPAGFRKEHSEILAGHHRNLVDQRPKLEESIANNNEETFDASGSELLKQAIDTKTQATLDIKGWKSLYNVYINNVYMNNVTARAAE